ncbi:MAG TPA: hypothetical protein PLR02_08430 [Rhodocyclaceae bacterium]|nr:hypothetical protein [Rhodocyclaceae bacterium]
MISLIGTQPLRRSMPGGERGRIAGRACALRCCGKRHRDAIGYD